MMTMETQMSIDRTVDDVYTYQKQALDLLDKDHPHYDEIRLLLTDQIMDDIDDCTTTNRGATST